VAVGSVGGPVNFWAVPFARITLPCGMEPMRKTILSPAAMRRVVLASLGPEVRWITLRLVIRERTALGHFRRSARVSHRTGVTQQPDARIALRHFGVEP